LRRPLRRAAIYVNAVEHPARLAGGTALALREFAPSYRRGTVLQASLATLGFLAAVAAWLQAGHVGLLIGGLLLGAVVPFTLVVIFPTNRRLLDPSLDPQSTEAAALLVRWGRLHAVRSVLSVLAFGTLLVCMAQT
jgi:hypothetical protein